MTLAQDLRDAIRQLRRSPGFTCAAVLSLALGIGANTAIFTLLDQVLLRRLPVGAPEELVQVSWQGARYAVTIGSETVSFPAYRDLRNSNTVFSGVLARYRLPLSVAFRGRTERVS